MRCLLNYALFFGDVISPKFFMTALPKNILTALAKAAILFPLSGGSLSASANRAVLLEQSAKNGFPTAFFSEQY